MYLSFTELLLTDSWLVAKKLFNKAAAQFLEHKNTTLKENCTTRGCTSSSFA